MNNTVALKVAIAQINTHVGAIENNAAKIIDYANQAKQQWCADLIVFSELTLCSYPPEDLLYRDTLYVRIDSALQLIFESVQGITLVLGYPKRTAHGLCNMAGVIQDGALVAEYAKHELPNYSVFDEKRYFVAGQSPGLFDINGITVGLSICEDAWHSSIIRETAEAGAELILNLNASPFHVGKAKLREQVIADRVLEAKVPIVYVNQVGAQDELVFDGGSFVMSADCQLSTRAADFKQDMDCIEFCQTDYGLQVREFKPIQYQTRLQSIYNALVLGVQDYVSKNGFTGAVIGLSGGIDSALTLAVACDALGADNVMAVSMPSRYTADMSIEDARLEAVNLQAQFEIVEIETMFSDFLASLAPIFSGTAVDTTEENIQARIRGVILMAISNKLGRIVLTTGNKSEMAVGYCTLYGDMAGGFSVLKDVSKTLVYQLADYRNSLNPVIPQRVIDRAPSAELAPGQKDQDSLPAYEILDAIIELYVEQDKDIEDIVAAGYEQEVVKKVVRLINRNEYKRRQAAPGIRISERAFGRDRRYPITSGFSQ